LAAGIVILLVTAIVAVALGSADLAVEEVLRSIASHLGLPVEVGAKTSDAIVWELRLPRVLTAVVVGAGLGMAGTVMQTLTRNPLADPYLLGLSSGASLGAAAVLLLGWSILLPLAAFIGAIVALLVTLTLARSADGVLTPTRVILSGLVVSQLAAAATSFVVFWTAKGDSYQEILAWIMGSLAGVTWSSAGIAAGTLVIIGGFVMVYAGKLDAFAFGDTAALALGVEPNRARWLLMMGAALLTGALVSVSGAIGFVGLLVPHAAAQFTGPSHRRLLPVSGIVGAILLVWADTIARTVFEPRELPVGIITALIGAPAFAVLLRRQRGGIWN
jgi:iron complex transport system permease protein